MKASQRHLLTFVGVAAALATSASPALAQAKAPPAGPRLMVPVFAGPKPLGLQAADELRERLKIDYQTKVIWTVPDFTIDRYRDRLRALHDQIERDGVFQSTMSRTS